MTTHVRTLCDETIPRSAEEGQPCQRYQEPWVLAATVLGSSMVFIDGTAVNVALPSLQADFGATAMGLQWVVESYALFLAALLVVGGSLGDKYGRRRIFGAGVVLFAAASAWCGLAPNMAQLIAARSLQGVGGALLVPGSLAIIGATFAPERRGRAIGAWSGLTAINMAVGPVLGGWLVENLSWRWIFFINIPAAVAVVLILLARVPESRGSHHADPLDWTGAGLVTFGLGAIVFGLIEQASLGLSHPLIVSALAGGAAALVAFLLAEWRGAAPMLPLGLFRSRSFSGANLLTFLLYAALSGAIFYLPFNLIQVQGYSATGAGASLLPLIVIMAVLSRWSGGLLDRYGAKLPLILGPAVAAGGFFLLSRPGIGGSYWLTFFPAIAVLGVGMSLCVAPLTTVVMNAVGEGSTGIASGVNNAVSRIAGLMAVAVLGIVVLYAFNQALDLRLEILAVPPEVNDALAAERFKLSGAELPAGLGEEMRGRLREAISQSFLSAYRLAMYVATGLALLSALSAALFIEGKPSARTSA